MVNLLKKCSFNHIYTSMVVNAIYIKFPLKDYYI